MHVSQLKTSTEPTAASPVSAVCRRGQYDEILSVEGVGAMKILGQFTRCLPETGIGGDKRYMVAVNVDLYGYDAHQGVAVVQAREFERDKRRGWTASRKTYFLCGFNEITNAPFRHPVSAAAIRSACRKAPSDPVRPIRAAQCWMWRCTERQLIESVRQGDVLLVRERRTPVGEEMGKVALVGGSHEIRASRIVRGGDGRIYALCPYVYHLKGQHDPICAIHEGWHSVRVAAEAFAWTFAERIGD